MDLHTWARRPRRSCSGWRWGGGLEATGMDRERWERQGQEEDKDAVKTDWEKKAKDQLILFVLKTFKIHPTRATCHVSALAKTRMTQNQIKDTLSKLCFISEELKIIFNCMKVSTQDLGDQIDALWNQMMLHWFYLRITKTCITGLLEGSRNRNGTEKWLQVFCSNPNKLSQSKCILLLCFTLLDFL